MSSLFHQNGLLQRASAAECAAFDARRPRMSSLFHQNKRCRMRSIRCAEAAYEQFVSLRQQCQARSA
jgi:hypothetical protein